MKVVYAFVVLYGTNLCCAQDVTPVTVYCNDTSVLTYVPPDYGRDLSSWFSNSSYCNGTRVFRMPGQSVSLPFRGTQASVFLRYWFGTGVVQITLDGTNVTMIDTRIMPNECGDRPWTSDVLSPDQHILTATHAGGPTIDGMSVDRFVYLPAAAPQQGSPTTTASPSPPTGTTGKNKSLIGAIVGSIAGAILLTMGIFFLRRHRGRGTTPEVTTIADDDKVEHVLPRPHDSQDIDLPPNNYPAPSSPRLPADGHPQLTLPPTSILRRPHSQLSDDQLDVVQRLVERNVPAPAIAGIVNSLLQQQSAVVAVQPAARDSRDDAPPMYN